MKEGSCFSTVTTTETTSTASSCVQSINNSIFTTTVAALFTGISVYIFARWKKKNEDDSFDNSNILEKLKEIGQRLNVLEATIGIAPRLCKSNDPIDGKSLTSPAKKNRKDTEDANLSALRSPDLVRGKLIHPKEVSHRENNNSNSSLAQKRISMTSSSSSSSSKSERLDGGTDPVPIVLVSDPGQDLDDEMMFIMARYLVSLNLISLKGVVANLHPSFARARLTRGTLDLLGLHRVPVGIGSDGGDLQGKHSSYQFESTASSYIIQVDGEAALKLESGHRLLQRLYDEASEVEYVDHNNDSEAESDCIINKSNREQKFDEKRKKTSTKVIKGGLVLVITSSIKDAAIFARDNPSSFSSKTREVVIMGGCKRIPFVTTSECNDGDSEKNEENASLSWSELAEFECEPDSAHNNTFDTAASEYFYSLCQKSNVTLTVVSRFAAYAAQMPRSVYDDLALTGSSIGWRLRNSQRASIDQLWKRACSNDPAIRKGLPMRCDRKWFINTFCGGIDDDSRCCTDTAWDLVKGFMQYDTIALLAAIPGMREKYFEPFVLPPLKKIASLDNRQDTQVTGAEINVDESSTVLQFSSNHTINLENKDDENLVGTESVKERKPIDNINIDSSNSVYPMRHHDSSEPIAFSSGTRNLIGTSDKKHNLKDPALLVDLLKTGFRAGILCNHHTLPHIVLHMQLRWDNLADTLMTCLMLRSLWDMRLVSVLGVIVSLESTDNHSDPERNSLNGDNNILNNADQSLEKQMNSELDASTLKRPDLAASTLLGLAETVRDTLSSIGLSHVKFHVVSGANMEEYKQKSTETFLELYESAPPIGVSLVLTSTFTSVWPFVESYPELFRNKTVRVVHTGGALIWPARRGWAMLSRISSAEDGCSEEDSSIADLTEEKILVPDPAAQNDRLDLPSARRFYNQAQSMSVPMVILSRYVAKECCIPRNFFEVLASHGGEVGKKIFESERDSLLNLWKCSCAPLGSSARGNLPNRCDRDWFAQTFCAGVQASNADEVWSAVESVNLYSPIALLAALPGETLKSYFQTMPFTVRSATHHVIGLSEQVPPQNAINPSELRSLVVQSLLSAALANESEFGKEPPPKVPIRMEAELRQRNKGRLDDSTLNNATNLIDDDDVWSFSEAARKELFSKTCVRVSKNLVAPREEVRKFVTLSEFRQSIGLGPPIETDHFN